MSQTEAQRDLYLLTEEQDIAHTIPCGQCTLAIGHG